MVPSIATAQAANERHAEFRREAHRAAVAEAGEHARASAPRVRALPRLRWSVARPRPA